MRSCHQRTANSQAADRRGEWGNPRSIARAGTGLAGATAECPFRPITPTPNRELLLGGGGVTNSAEHINRVFGIDMGFAVIRRRRIGNRSTTDLMMIRRSDQRPTGSSYTTPLSRTMKCHANRISDTFPRRAQPDRNGFALYPRTNFRTKAEQN